MEDRDSILSTLDAFSASCQDCHQPQTGPLHTGCRLTFTHTTRGSHPHLACLTCHTPHHTSPLHPTFTPYHHPPTHHASTTLPHTGLPAWFLADRHPSARYGLVPTACCGQACPCTTCPTHATAGRMMPGVRGVTSKATNKRTVMTWTFHNSNNTPIHCDGDILWVVDCDCVLVVRPMMIMNSVNNSRTNGDNVSIVWRVCPATFPAPTMPHPPPPGAFPFPCYPTPPHAPTLASCLPIYTPTVPGVVGSDGGR